MKKKKKSLIFNLIMVLLIGIIAVSGVMAVGSIRGWWDPAKDSVGLVSERITGIANIERKGIGYTLKKNVSLRAEDLIETKKGSAVELAVYTEDALVLNEHTELTYKGDDPVLTLQLLEGEVFADLTHLKTEAELFLDGHRLVIEDGVFAADIRSGSASVSVLEGGIQATASDGTQEYVEAGEVLSILEAEDGSCTLNVSTLQAASLNDFLIGRALACESRGLCFTAQELQMVLDDRAAQKQAALEAGMKRENRVQEETEEESETGQSDAKETESETEEDGESVYTGTVREETPAGMPSDDENSAGQEAVGDADAAMVCTIEIRCDTILGNMEKLSAGKEAYVPANGAILSTSSVEFEEGETVFDILKRVCDYAGIQLEYSWTPLYSTYYIEGINNLYEFDCGNESGWMYKVNGWYPNYGCSAYELKDGDVISWNYTCNGLGADLGAGM